MKKIYTIIIIVIIGAAGFIGGMYYGLSQGAPKGQQASPSQGAQRFSRGANGGMVSGQVVSFDDKSITVQSRSGGSEVVFYSSSTPVEKFISGSVKDLSDSAEITVIGSQNSDGSITAQSIQIRPSTSSLPSASR
jgi:hypothetical protein